MQNNIQVFFSALAHYSSETQDLECNEADEIVQKTPKNLHATFISVGLFGRWSHLFGVDGVTPFLQDPSFTCLVK